MTLTKKELKCFFAPYAKAAHKYANNYILHQTPNALPAGVVLTHNDSEPPKGGVIHWHKYTIEISMCKRARVVCNVPTPFSLFTFNYCLKLNGEQLAHGLNLDDFATNALRAIKKGTK